MKQRRQTKRLSGLYITVRLSDFPDGSRHDIDLSSWGNAVDLSLTPNIQKPHFISCGVEVGTSSVILENHTFVDNLGDLSAIFIELEKWLIMQLNAIVARDY